MCPLAVAGLGFKYSLVRNLLVGLSAGTKSVIDSKEIY
jgi:hypothetical protein